MLEPVSTIVICFLGATAAEVIGSAVKDHVKGHLKKLLASGEKKLLGKKERDALELAYENTLTHAYSGVLEALGKVLELAGIDFPDLVACANLVLAQPGYGIASECATHQTAFIAIERQNFRETPVLLEQFGELGRFVAISLADFLDGNWQDALTAAYADESPWATIAENPADAIARRIVELFGIGSRSGID